VPSFAVPTSSWVNSLTSLTRFLWSAAGWKGEEAWYGAYVKKSYMMEKNGVAIRDGYKMDGNIFNSTNDYH
jgi:hypothetical protein